MRGAGQRGAGADLGAIDGKLQMKMSEGVLDQPGRLFPHGVDRRMIRHVFAARLGRLPRR
ncbi:hypothetical protein AUC69_04135 [Methyloceanibacter superfactus]|uniref:Uncharacterized protein n=1 Tax=Methyloceanibacter superfactus TaxID=1774969 RepID=A0A1E3VLC7_9HYPH|nr:hypothetical protein AUC69_04135 [Methyloceanibacter superfactus]